MLGSIDKGNRGFDLEHYYSIGNIQGKAELFIQFGIFHSFLLAYNNTLQVYK